MPAYLLTITRQCGHPGCTKQATVRLHNTRNSPIDDYCRPHGDQALREHQRREKERS